jgi:thymidylate kinase
MMRIEFIGCTGAGKSTLTSRILRVCRAQGIDAWMGYDFVLRQIRLDWVENKLVRGLLVNLISLFVCLVAWQRHLAFCRFTIQAISRLPASVSWFERLYIGRDVLKNVGIYEIIRRRASAQQLVLLDEGTLHTAHYLFAHVAVEPNIGDVSIFAGLVPLPDFVVYVTQSESVLIERTLARGHKRIPDPSYASVERFIKRAGAIFEALRQQPALKGKLLVVDGQQNSIVDQDSPGSRSFGLALKLVRAGIDAANPEHPSGMVPSLGA